MKHMRIFVFVLIICLGSMLFLTGNALADAENSPQDTPEQYADTYSAVGLYYYRQYMEDDVLSAWTTTLNADGSGELYWGEDNQGPISEWSVQDGKVMIKAGVSEIDGIIDGGLMLLDMADECVLVCVRPGTDTEKIDGQVLEEYLTNNPEIFDYEPALLPEEIANVYNPVAFGDGKYCIAAQYDDGDGVITLNADGTGSMMTGTIENKLSWDFNYGFITAYDEAHLVPIFMADLEDGILTIDCSTENEDGSVNTQYAYFAVEGADLSGLSIITAEEYQAIPRG